MATGKSSPLVFLEKNDEAVSITYYSSLRVWLELCVLFTRWLLGASVTPCISNEGHNGFSLKCHSALRHDGGLQIYFLLCLNEKLLPLR